AVDLHAVRYARLLETVRPGALHAVGAHAVRRGERVRSTSEAADDAAGGVENVQPHLPILVLQPVVDHRPGARVLPYRARLVRRGIETARPVHPIGIAGLEEMRGLALL